MKLDSPSRHTSFYESFSDLIFAVMAIFVLLMLIFLTLIKPEASQDELEGALNDLQQLQDALHKTEAERDNARKQVDELVKSTLDSQSSIHSKGLELIIAIDVTGSMDDALGHLIETIRTITVVLPAISPTFRLGVIAYAQDNSGRIPNGLQIFDVKQIFAEQKDGGRSLQAINQYMGGLSRGVIAPVDRAILEGLKMFSRPDRFDGYQALMVIGDVGPYETGDGYKVEPEEKVIEGNVLKAMKNWTAQDKDRSVVSLYSAATPGSDATEKEKMSYDFFRKLAAESGQPDNFSQNPGKMLGYLLTAIIKDND
nr:hypothetical protein [Nitrosomonas nitrosa]